MGRTDRRSGERTAGTPEKRERERAGMRGKGASVVGVSPAAATLMAGAAIVAALIVGTLSSCRHKELCYPEESMAEIRVIFDWSAAPGARVEEMSLFFFPEQGGGAIRCDFADPNGGTVRIPWGDYRVIYLNNDTETILLRGTESYETFEIYTGNTSVSEIMSTRSEPRGANPEDAPVVRPPGQVWGGSRTEVSFVPSDSRTHTLVLPVYSKVCTYSFEVRGAENLKYVSEVAASFSGMSGSLFMANDATSTQRSLVPFHADSDGVSVIKGSTPVFGLSANTDVSRVLTLYLILADGSKVYYRFDVTAQMNGAADKRHIHIVLEGLPLPKPIVNGGGFHPTVEEWEEQEITISL